MNTKRTTIFLSGLLIMAQAVPVLAQPASTVMTQNNCVSFPGSDFGAVQLGATYPYVPKSFRRLPNCFQSAQYPEAACAWLDEKTGIEYDGSQGMITRKQIDISDKNPNPFLPFGLTPKDSAAQAQKKISALANAPTVRVIKTGTGGTRLSTTCIKGNRVEMLKVEIDFDVTGVFKSLYVTIPMGDVAPDFGKPNRPQF